jgi:hypothetical protein
VTEPKPDDDRDVLREALGGLWRSIFGAIGPQPPRPKPKPEPQEGDKER